MFIFLLMKYNIHSRQLGDPVRGSVQPGVARVRGSRSSVSRATPRELGGHKEGQRAEGDGHPALAEAEPP